MVCAFGISAGPKVPDSGAQETAKLEAQAYELEQKTALAHEAKTVLDSWVRYEGQVKQRQQKELAEAVIAKIEKELENPKTLKQILDQSVADVESKLRLGLRHIPRNLLIPDRDRFPEGVENQPSLEWSSNQSSACYIDPCAILVIEARDIHRDYLKFFKRPVYRKVTNSEKTPC